MASHYALAGSCLLKDKVVAVTGGSQGIGRAICLAAAAHGAKVVVHHFGDATRKDAIAISDEISTTLSSQAITVEGDIADPETATKIIRTTVSSFGRLDVLFSNAGICPFHDFLDMPNDLWRRVQDVNLNGAFYMVKEAANQMKQQQPQGGAIVAISSISALVGGSQQCHYTPTKAGIKSLMESCAVALGQYNIRCNAVLPGTVQTAINEQDLSDQTKHKYMSGRVPLGRLGEPFDVAGPAIFLASDLARYVTGSSLLVDGGLLMNLQ